jgi:hypothetical protein
VLQKQPRRKHRPKTTLTFIVIAAKNALKVS